MNAMPLVLAGVLLGAKSPTYDRTEPSLEAVQVAAAARVGASDALFRSWRQRARVSAWLPRLTAEYMAEERTHHVVGFQSSSELDYTRHSPGHRVGIRATWDLREVVFSRDELRVAEAAADLLKLRDQMVLRATELYLQRQRLRAEIAQSLEVEARAEAELKLAGITGELNAITSGLFVKGLEESKP